MMGKSGKRVLGEGKFVRLIDDEGWEYVERIRARGVITVIAITDEGEVLFVEQHRQSMGGPVLELPAGLVGDEGDAEEDHAEAARRELLEETGYEAAEMEWLTQGPSSTGLTNEVIQFYRARGLVRRGAGGGVEGESIRVHKVPLAEVDRYLEARIQAGGVIDPRIYIGLYFVRRQDGFAARSCGE